MKGGLVQISPSLIFSLMGLVALGIPMALGTDPHSSAMASRLAFLVPMLCLAIALGLAIRELKQGRSTRDWVRATIRLVFPIALILGIALFRW